MEKTLIRVLLVEDSPTDANLIKRVFTRANQNQWQVVHVERLGEAIGLYQTAPVLLDRFDIVLLDLHLPDCTGLDTLNEFRSSVPEVPVVVLTGLDDEEMALQSMAQGAQDYLVKDQITIQRILRAIQYAIERGQILRQLRDSEQQMRRALEKEQELSLLKSNFVSMVSHEFRTPMTTIRTAIEMLQYHQQLSESKREQYFDRIKASINNMLQMLDDVLLLGKAEAGALNYDPRPIDLVEFCRDLIETFQINARQHQLSFVSQEPYLQAEMDEDLLRGIFTNLLSNAIKYSPDGGAIALTLTCQNDHAILQVQDHGIGIPDEGRHRLFERFFRFSNARRIQGTGLGLAIVKRCVDLQHGAIHLDSEVNVGTTFTITLPLKSIASQTIAAQIHDL